MTFFEGLAYGIVQGLTEFLPVSSSAHLTLLPWFFGWEDPGLGFDVALHVGTLVAVLWYFWRDWWTLAQAALRGVRASDPLGNPEAALFWKLVVASAPAAVIGVLFEHAAEEAFRAPALIATTLATLGAFLYWADRRRTDDTPAEAVISWADAIVIGTAQAAAIVPGVSRSGITIAVGRLRGAGREAAARFSFLLSTPIIAGAALVKVKAFSAAVHDPVGFVAVAASAISGFAAIVTLLRYVRTRDYLPFVLYRFALAALVVVVLLTRP
jgi:undecaprenyl-diphosphatase